MRKKATLPICARVAAVKLLQGDAIGQCATEARADSLYALAFPNAALRAENEFYRKSPYIMEDK
jgi:hypothetical protein